MRRVTAKLFRKAMTSGTKLPALYRCTDGDVWLEVVVKCREALWRQNFSMVAERVASLMARHFGFESTEIVSVDFEPGVVDDVLAAGFPAYALQIERSAGPHVGSIYLGPGYWATVPVAADWEGVRAMLSAITAFDFIIQNFDRKRANPNFLRTRKTLVLIDHEQAFGHLDRETAEPFRVEMLLLEPFIEHVFFPLLDLATDADAVFQTLATLPDTIIEAWFTDLPAAWLDERSERLAAYLRWARTHANELRDHFLTLITP